jgi:hypothetical protein
VALKVDQIIGRRVLGDFCTASDSNGRRLCITLIGSDCRGVFSIYQNGAWVLMNKIDILNEISRIIDIVYSIKHRLYSTS